MSPIHKPDATNHRPHKRSTLHPFRAWLQRSFVTGIVVVTPLTVTLFLILWFARTVDNLVKPIVPEDLQKMVFFAPGIGILIVLILLLVVGAVTANFVGRAIVRAGDALVQRVPYVRTVYGALKQVVQTLTNRDEPSFKQVALMEFPRPGVWTLVFITGDPSGEIRNNLPEGYVTVLLSTAPNPASGFMMFVHRSQLRMLDVPVEQAAKFVLSLGILQPDDGAASDVVTNAKRD